MKRYIKIYTITPNKKSDFLEAVDEYLLHVEKDADVIECYIHQSVGPNSFIHFISFENTHNEEMYYKNIYVKNFENIVNSMCEKETKYIKLAKEGLATGLRPILQKEEEKEQKSISLYKKQEDIDNII